MKEYTFIASILCNHARIELCFEDIPNQTGFYLDHNSTLEADVVKLTKQLKKFADKKQKSAVVKVINYSKPIEITYNKRGPGFELRKSFSEDSMFTVLKMLNLDVR